MALGITGIPSHSLAGFPEGICRSGTEGVFVGGRGVFVDVFVGCGVLVGVGKFVDVGVDFSVGFGAKVLQDISVITSNERMIIFMIIFKYSLAFGSFFRINVQLLV
jgi:hypothetical protein